QSQNNGTQEEYSNSDLSIAVLPFMNMSELSENEFFAAGIHEDLLTSLSRIPQLAVISRTSVQRYADHDQSLLQIGEELNVNYVVEGSVRRQNEQVRISVQLIDARNDRHLWAMTYDRDLSDTFAVQSEITREVAEQLSIQFSEAEATNYDTEIHDLLFRTRELIRERSEESLATALESLRQARTSYPDNAQIHGDIGEVLYLQSRLDKSWQDVREETLGSLELALELDPELSGARLALARVQVWWLRDIQAADLNYQAVIRAQPNNADALMKYGEFLANTRAMRDVGMPHLRRAVALNPFSGEPWALLASNLMRAGSIDESYKVLMDGFDRVPNDYYLQRYQMEYFLYSGDRVEALKHLLELIRQNPNSLNEIALLASKMRELGFVDEAQLWLDEMIRINPKHSDTYLAEVSQLRFQKDWQGLAQINARWEPILGDFVTVPIRNWNLLSIQAEADRLWREGSTEQAQVLYREIASFWIDARIPDRMDLTVAILGAERLGQGILLARALTRTGRMDEATGLLTDIARNRGTGGAFALRRITALAMLGNADEAAAAFLEMLPSPGSGEAPWARSASVDETGIMEFMDESTDWLNGVNKGPEVVKSYETFLATLSTERNRVQAEIPALFEPAEFLRSARL
ncbi:MAG: tetratricopeptide repeat protein, partial [Pseudomonadales bacterium]